MLPAEQVGIVALTNAYPIGVPEAVCRAYLDLLLNGKIERDWLALLGQLLEKAVAPEYGTATDYSRMPAQPSPALAAAAYVGGYHSDLFGPIHIVRTDAGLVLKLGPGQDSFALRHFDRDTFIYQPVGENAYGPSAVLFMVGADQKAMSVTIENLDTNGQGRFSRVPG